MPDDTKPNDDKLNASKETARRPGETTREYITRRASSNPRIRLLKPSGTGFVIGASPPSKPKP